MDMNHKDGKMRVNFSDRLVTLLREVRLLGSLGFSIPSKIQAVFLTAQKFYRHAVILKQVFVFKCYCCYPFHIIFISMFPIIANAV